MTKRRISDKRAEAHYKAFMEFLGLDTTSPHSIDTPARVVKAFKQDLFSGLFNPEPKITVFDNTDGYDGIVFQGNIPVKSMCSHHHLPFIGTASVAYIPDSNGKVIGLSKLNRIVEHFARRPQVQENLTMQIVEYVNKMTEENQGVAVHIIAKHLCTCVRGINHDSQMQTAKLTGVFFDRVESREEFYTFINHSKYE